MFNTIFKMSVHYLEEGTVTVCKLILLGSSGVGKSSLIHRFVQSEYSKVVPTSAVPEVSTVAVNLDDKGLFSSFRTLT